MAKKNKKRRITYTDYFTALSDFEIRKKARIQEALEIKRKNSNAKNPNRVYLTKEEKKKAVRGLTSGLSREERKKFDALMRDKYATYEAAWKEATKTFGKKRTVNKMDIDTFKKQFGSEFLADTENRQNLLRDITSEANLRTLTRDMYSIKRDNLMNNIARYERKLQSGMPLTEGEKAVVDVLKKMGIKRPTITQMYAIVKYFDELGYEHEAFDSAGA